MAKRKQPNEQPAEEPPSIMERLKRVQQPSAQPQRLDQTWQALPVNVDDEEDDAPTSPPANTYEESTAPHSETPTIELQRIKHNASGIQSEGSAEDMRRAIERMRQKRQRNRASRNDD